MDDETAQQCAATVMDTFHMMMRAVGPEAHKNSAAELSMHQFRAMMTMKHHEGASLSHLSERLGTTLSAASKLIEGLVERGYVRRETAKDDRRKLILALTDTGGQAVASVHLEVVTCLAGKLATLSANERAMVDLAMDLLRSAIVPTQTKQLMHSGEREL